MGILLVLIIIAVIMHFVDLKFKNDITAVISFVCNLFPLVLGVILLLLITLHFVSPKIIKYNEFKNYYIENFKTAGDYEKTQLITNAVNYNIAIENAKRCTNSFWLFGLTPDASIRNEEKFTFDK
jgi:hypothetical protein